MFKLLVLLVVATACKGSTVPPETSDCINKFEDKIQKLMNLVEFEPFMRITGSNDWGEMLRSRPTTTTIKKMTENGYPTKCEMFKNIWQRLIRQAKCDKLEELLARNVIEKAHIKNALASLKLCVIVKEQHVQNLVESRESAMLECVREISKAVQKCDMPNSIKNLTDILAKHNSDLRKPLSQIEISDEVFTAVTAIGYQAECGWYNRQFEKRIKNVECSKNIDFTNQEHLRFLNERYAIDLALAARKMCDITLKQCINEMNTAIKKYPVPESIWEINKILIRASPSTSQGEIRLLTEDEIMIYLLGYPVECDEFKEKIRDALNSVNCSKHINPDDLNQVALMVDESELNEAFASLNSCKRAWNIKHELESDQRHPLELSG